MAQNNLIDGRAIATQIQGELAQRISELKSRGVQPGLAFVRVGEDPASKVYVGRRADILIAAMGVAEFVKADMVKAGAVVIDVGVNRVNDPAVKSGSRLVGDVAFDEVQPIAGKITPNPGGVGPKTIAMLMPNTVRAAEDSMKVEERLR